MITITHFSYTSKPNGTSIKKLLRFILAREISTTTFKVNFFLIIDYVCVILHSSLYG